MKDTIRTTIWELLAKLQRQIEKSDSSYQIFLKWNGHRLSYEEFKQAEADWDALEERYGDWSSAYEHEPDEVLRLEMLLA